MHARDRRARQAQPVRKGIVAHSTVRLAAGAGVIAASLLIVGPNPAQAAADKHGSGHSNGDYRKNGSSGGNANRGASNGDFGQDLTSNLDPPLMDLGSDGAPGSAYSGQPAMSFRAPRVVVGNGRIPGTHTRASVPEAVLYDSLDSPAAVPAVPEAIEINFPPLPPPLPPVESMRPALLVVGEFSTGTADTMTDPLAGVAGLFLIPAIGVVLGYRQARAAQSLRESLRT